MVRAIPTTWSDENGEYVFEGAPIGELVQSADKRDWLGVSRVITSHAGPMDVPDLALSPGRTVEGVVLDEAVTLAKTYSTEGSGRFVNGVLDAVASARPDGAGT